MQSSQNSRILIVDDVADNVLLLQTILEAEGYQVETATSGRAALMMLQQAEYNLVLLDVMMPDMSGFEVTQQIRQNYRLATLPILLITAHDRTTAHQGLNLGADDFVSKPVDFDQLLTKVEKSLQAHRQNPEKKIFKPSLSHCA
jgi:CheY-like chemotaxis protein